MQGIPLLVFSCIALYVCQKLLGFWRAVQSIQNHPGLRQLFSPPSLFGLLLPKIKYLNQGRNALFLDKHQVFVEAGWDIISSITIYPNNRTALLLADAAAIKRNNKLVWDETLKIVNGLFEDVWKNQDVVHVDHCLDITLPIALFVIGVAGFGKTISWKEDDVIPPGHSMTFKDALHTVTTHFYVKILVPSWAMGFTAKTRKTRQAFSELHLYMKKMVRERQNDEKVERDDLLSSLLAANDHDLDGSTLSEDELIGNIFIFLVAGHETTAHTLCFVFALLALYQDEQEKLYQHIRSVVPKDREATYEDMPALTYAMAVFYETLRLYPAGAAVPKVSAEDTTLVAGNINDEKLTVPVPKGTPLTLSVAGVHYNPRYWEDPTSFKPARFLKDWPRDAFLPFSAGARACLGRKFFETEGIVTLTTLVSKYKITVKDEPQFAGETFEQRRERVLTIGFGLTLTPVRVPLTFTRRT
ncbi:hypothetical protein CVT25_001442 [Psilocybe cyanescens]|uniref:Cytochrome P450 n=1 Tax=Psilocybe cyanescens TaxID=93625 RepID=A0A409WNR2_PSICY|nr:hypothetical protein CVT25_001442 [Psilocybe cyanescens]